MPDYQIRDLRQGDLVLLRWVGDRRVPNREGQTWATVDEVLDNDRARVFNCTYGSTRCITVEHIFRVQRKIGRNVYEPAAKRVPAANGTRLVRC